MPANAGHKTVVVIPTYNEAQNITRLVGDLFRLSEPLDVLIVDDNSPDGTGALADELANRYPDRLFVIHRPGKNGLGTAYIEGWRWVLARDYARVLTMDADYSHHPRYIPAMFAEGERLDLVVGSRYTPGGRVIGSTVFRRVLSHGANALARATLRIDIHDLTASFRLYRREVLGSLPLGSIRSEGYSFPIEVAWLAGRLGWRLGEVPIVFENRTRGASKVSRGEIAKALFTLLRLAAGRAPILQAAVPVAPKDSGRADESSVTPAERRVRRML